MNPFAPTIDIHFREYAELQLRRHHLLVDGKEEDAETGEIEDRMGELWEKLDDAQRRSVNGMGSDLNWVRRRGALPPKGRKPDEVTSEDKARLKASVGAKEWHAVLHHLRICAAAMDPGAVAWLRVNAYAGIGLQSLSELFRDFAASFGPSPAETNPVLYKFFPLLDAPDGGRSGQVHFVSARGRASPADSAWAPDVSADEEAAGFAAALSLGIADDRGRMYGLVRDAGGVREIGSRHQQFVEFSRVSPDVPWYGCPIWPLNYGIHAGRPVEPARPPVAALWKMEASGLLTRRERKRLMKGSHV